MTKREQLFIEKAHRAIKGGGKGRSLVKFQMIGKQKPFVFEDVQTFKQDRFVCVDFYGPTNALGKGSQGWGCKDRVKVCFDLLSLIADRSEIGA